MYSNIPWIEKYRPIDFHDIVMDEVSKTIFMNMVRKNRIPNMLFYGPPGTGKTTTAINIIRMYQKSFGKSSNSMIHLNASDDRGIDVIRTQIYTFVSSMSMFETGLKFVILDEADYMTKPAQLALKSIIRKYGSTVRVCMMCNYISKIDQGLLSDFVIFRFNNLPLDKVFSLLMEICLKENLCIDEYHLRTIQSAYKSDIRSMINCIQTYKFAMSPTIIITDEFIQRVYYLFKHKHPISEIINAILSTERDPKYVILYLFKDMIQNRPDIVTHDILEIMANVQHFTDCPISCLLYYTVTQLYDKI